MRQVREVFPDGSLGPIEQRPKPPRHPQAGAPPAATISKYSGCSRDELLQKVKDVRAQKEILEQKKRVIPGRLVSLPKQEKNQLRVHLRELEELQSLLKKADAVAAGEDVLGDDGVDACAGDDDAADAGEAVVFSGSDEDGEQDE